MIGISETILNIDDAISLSIKMPAYPDDVKTKSSFFIWAINFVRNLEHLFSSLLSSLHSSGNSMEVHNFFAKFLMDLS